MGKECCGNDEDHTEDLIWTTADYSQKKCLAGLYPTEYARFVEEFRENYNAGESPKESLALAFKTID